MRDRQRPDGHYNQPTFLLGTWWRVWWDLLWYRLGFDPLSRRRRLAQVEREALSYQTWLGDVERQLQDLGCLCPSPKVRHVEDCGLPQHVILTLDPAVVAEPLRVGLRSHKRPETVADLLVNSPDEPAEAYDDAVVDAWALIANAYGGDWDAAPHDWSRAAERWRDCWLKVPSSKGA